MKYTDEAYIKLIANAIGNNKYDIDFSLVSKDRLVKLCVFHRTIGLIWLGMSKLENLPDDYKRTFVSGLKHEVIEYVNKSDVLERLSEKLSDNAIKHVLVKGKTIAKYYPQEELRRFGDIDILISPKDKEQVSKIIIQMGGEYYYEKSNSNVDVYKLDDVGIDVHSKIVSGKAFSKSNIYECFTSKAYESSIKVQRYLYELDYETAMVYSIYHVAKHFYEGGCGVRMITDLWLMKNTANPESYKSIIDKLEDMGLKEFAFKVFSIGEKWFGNSQVEVADFNEIQDYIMTSGMYGKGNIDNNVGQIRKSDKGNYLINVLLWLFPSCKEMRERNLWFKDKPAILLPVAYIVRGYTNIKKQGNIIGIIKNIFKGKKKNSSLNRMLRIMGLYNE